MPQRTPDLTDLRFGRLTVLERAPRDGSTTHAQWICRCDCGTTKTVNSSALRNGHTVSCGCLRRELLIARSIKHGLMPRDNRSPSYSSWANMIARTTNPDHPRWADWGGRGITVCERWRQFPAFLADMGEKPPGTSIERKDNSLGYEPGNCCWATPAEQNRNKRSTKLTVTMITLIEHLHDRGLGISAIARRTEIDRHTVGTVVATVEALRAASPA